MRKLGAFFCLLQLSMLGCSDDRVDVTAPNEPTFDELVYQNCLLVQAAAEAYFAENGEYSYLPWGEFDNYLPDSTGLTNPATGLPTEPTLFEPSGPGSVSYRVFAEYDQSLEWRVVGYYIVGRGQTQDFTITNVENPEVHIDRERIVLENCFILKDAINDYIAKNGGVYPTDGNELNHQQFRLIDLLPNGQLLLNPYTNERTEPSWPTWNPENPGQLTYCPADADGDGVNDGCRVEALGCYPHNNIYYLFRGHWYNDEFIGYDTYRRD